MHPEKIFEIVPICKVLQLSVFLVRKAVYSAFLNNSTIGTPVQRVPLEMNPWLIIGPNNGLSSWGRQSDWLSPIEPITTHYVLL